MFAKLLRGGAVHRFRRPVLHFPSDEMTGFPFRKRGDGLLFALAHDGVAFPVSEPLPVFDTHRAGIDHSFVRDDYFLIFLLPPALFPEKEVLPELRMIADPRVHGLRADVRRFLFFVPSLCDLIGTPALPQFPDHECFE